MFAPPPRPRPPAVDLREHMPPPFDQGDIGSCTANAIAAALVYDQAVQNEPIITPSRLFIYHEERARSTRCTQMAALRSATGSRSYPARARTGDCMAV
jgi:hypothetical protein